MTWANTILSDTSLYLKHFSLNRFPYRQQSDPDIFFAEAGRGEILRSICADIASGKHFIKLIGSEGTGKTLLYLLLARKLDPAKFETVCLDHPVGSFEDLLRIICRSLGRGLEADKGTGCTEYLPELRSLLQQRSRAGRRVVLVIDEAEKLFLATFERLVRLLSDIGQEGLLQILLIGRPDLDKNLQQLSSYSIHLDMQASYALVPLDLSETARYLRFRLLKAGSSGEKARSVFSDEAVSSLYQQARGNLSLTNLMAEQGLVRAYESGMFQVETELISPRQARVGNYATTLFPVIAWVRKYRLQALAGAFLGLALLLVALWPEGEERVSPVAPVAPVATVAQMEKKAPTRDLEETKNMVEKVEAAKALAEKAVLSLTSEDEIAVVTSVEPSSLAAAPEAVKAAVKETGKVKPVHPDLSEEKPADAVTVAPFLPIDALSAVVREPAAAEIPLLEAFPAQDEKKAIVLRAERRKRKVAEATNGQKVPAVKAATNPQQVFTERMRASAKWRVRSGYTLQLMVLASNIAEENFKGLLAQDRYVAVQDQLYVVRKAVPPTLFIYYGFFNTMAEARQGRDRLPDFLRKNQPYALSISQVLKKAED